MKTIFSAFSCLLLMGACSSSKEESTSIDKSKLLGVWWDSNDPSAPTATFMIEDSTIHYPDTGEGEPSDFKYWLKGDSLMIEYADYVQASKINKATGDTLELITEGDKLVLVKTEPKP